MQNFKEFLLENYDLKSDEFKTLSVYERRIIEKEYDSYLDSHR